jgi:hypothetical protein
VAAQTDQEAPAGRLVLLIGLLALAAVTAAAFGRVFQGHGPAFRLTLAGWAAILLAGALERRHVLLSAAVSAAGLALAIGLLVFPNTTVLGFPTLSTLRGVSTALHNVGRTAAVQVAPAIPLRPLMLAALVAMWTAAFASHALAARARSPFLALLPAAALLAFAGIVLEDGVRPAYVVAFLVTALGVLFADGLRRVGQWGPLTMWHGRRSLRFGSPTTTRGARLLAVACIGIAAFTPWILPGFRSEALLNIAGTTSHLRVSIDPIVDIRPRLLNTPAIHLFTVQSDRPSYWRFITLDRFDGRQWSPTDLDASRGVSLGSGPLSGGLLLADASAGSADARTLTQRFVFDRLDQPWLPAAAEPSGITVGRGEVRYDARSGLLVSPDGTYPGFNYQVNSLQVVPTPQALNVASPLTGPSISPFVQLPRDTPAQIYSIARQLTAGATTPYQKVLAIQNYLKTFRYDVRVPAGHDVNHILYFLTKSHAGYCEQFAGTMAVLLRALGIPSRVAVGFTPGTFDPKTQSWNVTTADAHAWVEVLFPQYGWLAFEPTPTRDNPVARPYADTSAGNVPSVGPNCPLPLDANGRCPSAGQGSTHRPKFGKDPFNFELPQDKRDLGLGTAAARGGRHSWVGLAWKGALALLALVLLLVPLSKVARRRLAMARARAPGDRVMTAYRNLLSEAADVGLGRFPAETLWEYRVRLKESVQSLDGELDRLTGLAGRVAYSERAVSDDQAQEAVSAARHIGLTVRRSVAPARRLMGWFRLVGERR